MRRAPRRIRCDEERAWGLASHTLKMGLKSLERAQKSEGYGRRIGSRACNGVTNPEAEIRPHDAKVSPHLLPLRSSHSFRGTTAQGRVLPNEVASISRESKPKTTE
jgi:hypothetical protein